MCKTTGWVFSVAIILTILAGPLSAQMVTEEWVEDVPEFQWSATTTPKGIWTGSKFIVLTVSSFSAATEITVTGRIYDPSTDTWDLTPNLTTGYGAPRCCGEYTAVWTGDRLIVWGASNPLGPNQGGIYDPSTDSWFLPANLQTVQGSPLNRFGHVAVWTGTHMFIYGGSTAAGTSNTGYMYDPSVDTWESLPNLASGVGAPPLDYSQQFKAGVWTGTHVVVIGKQDSVGGTTPVIGGSYNPTTDAWEVTPTLSEGINAPVNVIDDVVTAYWTGSNLLTWSGSVGSGGLYDPQTDSWVSTLELNGSNALPYRAAAWTGFQLLVWGDSTTGNNGGAYDPAIDSWVSLPNLNSGSGAPMGRSFPATAWTGSHLIVWGGAQGTPAVPQNTGGLYELSADSWVPTSVLNSGWESPEPRELCSTVWTGETGNPVTEKRMIVWGGKDTVTGTGAISGMTGRVFDSQAKKWSTPPNLATGTGAPPPRKGHGAVWTGSKMIVWGGISTVAPNLFRNDGGIYDLATDAWEPAPNFNAGIGAPMKRTRPITIWTGQKLFVYGGITTTTGNAHKGGIYDPATDTWESLPNLNNGINAPLCETSINNSWSKGVWTGSQVIIWGKDYQHRGIYTPETDTWEITPQFNSPGAPHPRYLHSAVWTGNDMLVWGGIALEPPSTGGPVFGGGGPQVPVSDPSNNGARYEPEQDIWQTGGGLYSASGGPGQRYRHTAVWTGETGNPLTEKRMIVWGGVNGLLGGGTKLKSGGVYNSETNTWQSATQTIGAPSARDGHSAVWTGTSMIIWGGDSDFGITGGGGKYDLGTNTWAPAAQMQGLNFGEHKPSAKSFHTTVWTGSQMIVYGGFTVDNVSVGGIYTPQTDTWEDKPNLKSGIGAPPGMLYNTATWTGSKMIVWGGLNWNGSALTNAGGVYEPASDTWESLPNFNSGIGAPEARTHSTSVWTGSRIIVWGGAIAGSGEETYSNTGGIYDPATDSWEPAPNLNAGIGAPTGRKYHTMIWTGSKVVVWGGYDANEHSQTGAVYDPSTDTWSTPGNLGANADVPNNIEDQEVMWTGNKLLIWGGSLGSPGTNDTILHGYLYNLTNDEWESRPILNTSGTCPIMQPVNMHAVCTGTRMIVWGGDNPPFVRVGAVYDLATDSWLNTPNLDMGVRSPAKRDLASVFWTGQEMIVWGGAAGSQSNCGGIYRYEVAYSPPVLASIGNQKVYEGETLAFTATATDDDFGEVLTYSLDAAAVALGMTIDPNTGEFTWAVPLHAGLGGTVQYATITVTDSTFNTDSETIEITIPLGTPVLATIGSKSIDAGRTLTFTASATDPNPGDTLTYSLDAASVALGMKIDPNTGAFKWTPRLALAGTTVVVTITATDGAGLMDTETFKIAIEKPKLIRVLK